MHQSDIETGWVDDQVGYLLRRASAAMAADYANAAEPGWLRPVQISMLAVVAANPGLGQSKLGASLGIQRTNTAPLVAQLVQAGLIDRRPSATDRRSVELHLTDAGFDALAVGQARIADHEARMTAGLTSDERSDLVELLHRIVDPG